VLALARIAVLVERAAVEACERVIVPRKVPRHPVEQHADAERVQVRDELAELVLIAVAARGREVPRALITPRIVERVLGDRQQLHVREAEVADVRAELAPELAVAQELARRTAAPRSEMHFVDRHRLAQPIARVAPRHPVVVAPTETRALARDAGSGGPVLEPHAVRVALEPELMPVAREDLVLVELARLEVRDEQLPDARIAAHAHRVIASVPVVERPDHADALGIGGPDRESEALHAGNRELLCAEKPVRMKVIAPGETPQVVDFDVRCERVRIVALMPGVVVRLPADPVRRRHEPSRADPLEQRGVADAR
jgi:hypothetical protein